jgi:hypothetical protein
MKRGENKSVRVTADEQRHPAYKLLARAAIALARVQLGDRAADGTGQSKRGDAANQQEARHD